MDDQTNVNPNTDEPQAAAPDTEAEQGLLGATMQSARQESASGRRRLLGSKQAGERGWYVIHTYTGYEDQVAETLRQRIESLGMSEKIFDVIVPTERQIEIKN